MTEQKLYRGNENLKGTNVEIEWTPEMIREYQKCSIDPVYFSKKYVYVINLDEGRVLLDLYPYQEEMMHSFNENRFNIVLAARQSGKTVACVAYLLWYAIFHSEQTIAIVANKGDTAREILSRFMLALESLPFFLQPGTKEYNKSSIKFDNDTNVYARATSSNSLRGLSVSLLYLDEFAFVEDAEKFYTSTYPVISSGKRTRVIITSTANGIGNPFYNIWTAAVSGDNEYNPIRVDWWDVPGRDEQWKQQTIKNTSVLQFEQEFANSFIATGNTLFSTEALLELRHREPVEYYENNNMRIFKKPRKGNQYVLIADVGKGRGQDFSVATIIDITRTPFKQAAVYSNNNISPLLFPDIILKYAQAYNNAFCIVENNDQGMLVASALYYEHEYEHVYVSGTKSSDVGLYVDKRNKRIGCSNIKDLIDMKKLEIYDQATIREMTTFIAKGDTFKAEEGNHDDHVMTLVIFAYIAGTPMFDNEFDTKLRDFVYKEHAQAIQDDMLPFGVVSTSMESEHQQVFDFTDVDMFRAWYGW